MRSGLEGLILPKTLARDVELCKHAIPTGKDIGIALECATVVFGHINLADVQLVSDTCDVTYASMASIQKFLLAHLWRVSVHVTSDYIEALTTAVVYWKSRRTFELPDLRSRSVFVELGRMLDHRVEYRLERSL